MASDHQPGSRDRRRARQRAADAETGDGRAVTAQQLFPPEIGGRTCPPLD
jgi:hypothetical protein